MPVLPPAPKVLAIQRFFDAEPNLKFSYGFSTLRDGAKYRTWFFAPTQDYRSASLKETIYTASVPVENLGPFAMTHTGWQVYTGGEPDRHPFVTNNGAPTLFKPQVDHPIYKHVGDPSVIKIGSRYLMLYSVNEWQSRNTQRTIFHVFGAESADGVNWEGQKWMWHGHRPAMLIDDDILHCWYDKSTGPRFRRTIRKENIDQFLDTSSEGPWSDEQPLTGLSQNNIDVIKKDDYFFAVSDGGRRDRITINGWHSLDGVNFTPYGPIASVDDLPSSDRDKWNNLDVPQLVTDGPKHLMIATAKVAHAPKRTFLFALQFEDSDWIKTPIGNVFHSSTIPGFHDLPAVRREIHSLKEYRIDISRGNIPNHSYAGIQFFPPRGNVVAVSFDFVTNFSSNDVFAAVTLPGNYHRYFRKFENDGETVGSASFVVPNKPWVGFGLFSKRQFACQHDNWTFRLQNLKLFYD